MTLKTLGLNGTPGATLTAANSGASTVVPNGGTATFSTDFTVEGATGAKFTAATNALSIARFTSTASNLAMSYGVAFMVPANPAKSWINFASLRASGAPLKANWTAAGTIDIRDQSNANPVTLTGTYQTGKGYWLSIRAKAATSTTGTFTANVYDLGTRALVGTASSSTYNLGTVAITGGDIGVVNGDPTAGDTAYFDLLSFDDGSTAEILPPVVPVNYQGVLGLTGSGTLAGTTTAATTTALPLTGAGTVTQAATAAGTSGVALAGSGSLTQATTVAGTSALPLTGTGSLTEAAIVAASTSAPTAGTGALTLTSTTNQTASLNLTTTGSLDMATSAARTVAVALAGSGTFAATSTGGAQTARLDLTSVGSLELSGAVAHVDTLNLAGMGTLNLLIAGTEHHDLLELAGLGTLTFTELGKQRDITVTAAIQPRTWAATLGARRYAAQQQPRRWDAHANVPTRNH
jgi:hypothetical protein